MKAGAQGMGSAVPGAGMDLAVAGARVAQTPGRALVGLIPRVSRRHQCRGSSDYGWLVRFQEGRPSRPGRKDGGSHSAMRWMVVGELNQRSDAEA